MKSVFFDIDTQIDFVFPAGALYARGAERILPAVGRLNHWAAAHGMPVISTMDAHAPDDAEFRHWPPHCVVGTASQAKPASTLLAKRGVVHPNGRGLDAVLESLPPQVLLEKRHVDCFTLPHLPRLLERLPAEQYVVYGVVTEVCVWHAVAGLLKIGKRVALVRDAVQGLDAAKSAAAMERALAEGATLTTVDELIAQGGP